MPKAPKPLCLIQFLGWENSISPLLYLLGNKNWPPSIKVKKLENLLNKKRVHRDTNGLVWMHQHWTPIFSSTFRVWYPHRSFAPPFTVGFPVTFERPLNGFLYLTTDGSNYRPARWLLPLTWTRCRPTPSSDQMLILNLWRLERDLWSLFRLSSPRYIVHWFAELATRSRPLIGANYSHPVCLKDLMGS